MLTCGLVSLQCSAPKHHPGSTCTVKRGLRDTMSTGVSGLAVLGFNLFGDTLRDAWDPKLRGRREAHLRHCSPDARGSSRGERRATARGAAPVSWDRL